MKKLGFVNQTGRAFFQKISKDFYVSTMEQLLDELKTTDVQFLGLFCANLANMLFIECVIRRGLPYVCFLTDHREVTMMNHETYQRAKQILEKADKVIIKRFHAMTSSELEPRADEILFIVQQRVKLYRFIRPATYMHFLDSRTVEIEHSKDTKLW
tara:strand:- start:112 stop:579 length:468 start_codon:yes stop_codon:yes gene_type:complete